MTPRLAPLQWCPACVLGLLTPAGCTACGLGAPHPSARSLTPKATRRVSHAKLEPALAARRHAETLARMGDVECAECGEVVPRTGTTQLRCPPCGVLHNQRTERARQRRRRLERGLADGNPGKVA